MKRAPEILPKNMKILQVLGENIQLARLRGASVRSKWQSERV